MYTLYIFTQYCAWKTSRTLYLRTFWKTYLSTCKTLSTFCKHASTSLFISAGVFWLNWPLVRERRPGLCVYVLFYTPSTLLYTQLYADIYVLITQDTGRNVYGVATISRLLKSIGLFCKRDPQKRPIISKETYTFKELTHRCHPIQPYPPKIWGGVTTGSIKL